MPENRVLADRCPVRHIILVMFGSRPLPYSDYTARQDLRWGPASVAPRPAFQAIHGQRS